MIYAAPRVLAAHTRFASSSLPARSLARWLNCFIGTFARRDDKFFGSRAMELGSDAPTSGLTNFRWAMCCHFLDYTLLTLSGRLFFAKKIKEIRESTCLFLLSIFILLIQDCYLRNIGEFFRLSGSYPSIYRAVRSDRNSERRWNRGIVASIADNIYQAAEHALHYHYNGLQCSIGEDLR